MIIINFSPTGTDPPDGEKPIEQEASKRGRIAGYILGLIVLLAAIIIPLVTAG
jgi:hypothetical protein